MATNIYGFVQFNDGTFASLVNDDVTAETATEIKTGPSSLNQVAGVSIGSAYEGKVAIAAAFTCQTDNATTACFANGYFLGPDGKIICIIMGNGTRGNGLYPLAKPVRMQTGVKAYATFDTQADAVALASLAVYCADGTADVFSVKAVDATKTAMLNKDGATIGQALAGKSIVNAYATYSASNGLNDDATGVGGFYIEAADGQLKYMFPPQVGLYKMDWQMQGSRPIRINQNDTLSVTAGYS